MGSAVADQQVEAAEEAVEVAVVEVLAQQLTLLQTQPAVLTVEPQAVDLAAAAVIKELQEIPKEQLLVKAGTSWVLNPEQLQKMNQRLAALSAVYLATSAGSGLF